MRRVAWLTGARWREGPIPHGTLPRPDAEDFALVAPMAADFGLEFGIARWDSDLAAQGFDAALVRSTWDYADRRADFIARLEAHAAAGVPVFNPPALIAWNARKTYLEALGAHGAPVIPTVWTDAVDAAVVLRAFDEFDAAEIVVKPQVGAGSRNTIRLRRNGWSEADLIAAPPGPAMLQPFLPAIETTGEASLFWFGGRPAHMVRKRAKPGGWLANVDGAQFARGEATTAEKDAAARVMALAPPGLLYARVDLVDGPDGAPLLIELEAIEPYLFLIFAPEGAGFLLAALRDAVGATALSG